MARLMASILFIGRLKLHNQPLDTGARPLKLCYKADRMPNNVECE